MRFFRQRDAAPIEDDEETLEQDEEIEEEEEDDLEDLDPEVRERVERATAKQVKVVEARIAAARQGLQARGLDLAEDGTTVIRDPGKAGEWLGRRERPAERADRTDPPNQTKQTVDEPEDERWPDPYTEPKEFQKRFLSEVGKVTAGHQAQVQQMQELMVAREVEHAMDRTPEAIHKYAPSLEPLLDHPDFEEAYLGYLKQFPVSTWNNAQNLARIAGMVVADLDMEKVPATRARGKKPPEPDVTERARGAANRRILEQTGPSRGTGKTPRAAADVDEVYKEAAARLGISVEEAQALAADVTGDSYLAARRKQQAKERGR